MEIQGLIAYVCIGLIWMNTYKMLKADNAKHSWALVLSSIFFFVPVMNWLINK